MATVKLVRHKVLSATIGVKIGFVLITKIQQILDKSFRSLSVQTLKKLTEHGCVSELGHNWSVAYLAPNHYMNQLLMPLESLKTRFNEQHNI